MYIVFCASDAMLLEQSASTMKYVLTKIVFTYMYTLMSVSTLVFGYIIDWTEGLVKPKTLQPRRLKVAFSQRVSV